MSKDNFLAPRKKSIRQSHGNLGFDIPDIQCQGCKVGLFAVKKLLENKFIIDLAISLFSGSICPLVAMNNTVCDSGPRIMGEPLVDAIT
jgi:hypothetical protein